MAVLPVLLNVQSGFSVFIVDAFLGCFYNVVRVHVHTVYACIKGSEINCVVTLTCNGSDKDFGMCY